MTARCLGSCPPNLGAVVVELLGADLTRFTDRTIGSIDERNEQCYQRYIPNAKHFCAVAVRIVPCTFLQRTVGTLKVIYTLSRCCIRHIRLIDTVISSSFQQANVHKHCLNSHPFCFNIKTYFPDRDVGKNAVQPILSLENSLLNQALILNWPRKATAMSKKVIYRILSPIVAMS